MSGPRRLWIAGTCAAALLASAFLIAFTIFRPLQLQIGGHLLRMGRRNYLRDGFMGPAPPPRDGVAVERLRYHQSLRQYWRFTAAHRWDYYEVTWD